MFSIKLIFQTENQDLNIKNYKYVKFFFYIQSFRR